MGIFLNIGMRKLLFSLHFKRNFQYTGSFQVTPTPLCGVQYQGSEVTPPELVILPGQASSGPTSLLDFTADTDECGNTGDEMNILVFIF